MALVRDAAPLHHADLVFLESTYGDRDHRTLAETLAEFRGIIEQVVREKARILVPAFAVGRTQQILFHLDELFSEGVAGPFPVYIGSPMAIEATRIYRSHPDLLDEKTRDLERASEIARHHRQVKPTPSALDSMALNNAPGPCLIMAGAGMCTGDRILHHLKHGLWRPETVVMIVGYQVAGSLGRMLADGTKSVRIFGEQIAVKAQIKTLNGFSAHAGQTELMTWLGHLTAGKPRVVLTHGEASGREPPAALIHQRHRIRAVLPVQGDVIELGCTRPAPAIRGRGCRSMPAQPSERALEGALELGCGAIDRVLQRVRLVGDSARLPAFQPRFDHAAFVVGAAFVAVFVAEVDFHAGNLPRKAAEGVFHDGLGLLAQRLAAFDVSVGVDLDGHDSAPVFLRAQYRHVAATPVSVGMRPAGTTATRPPFRTTSSPRSSSKSSVSG
jgi:metallo-beta-lactamase family protein